MTIKHQEPNILDRLLKIIGKKRGIIVPSDIYEKFGPYIYFEAKRESFWKALFRGKNQKLPQGVIDMELISDSTENDIK